MVSMQMKERCFCVLFKGICPIQNRRHKSNNMAIYFSKSRITARCLDSSCGQFKSNSISSSSPICEIFFGNTCGSQMLEIVQVVDPGVTNLTLTQEAFESKATNQMAIPYKKNSKHVVTVHKHRIVDEGSMPIYEANLDISRITNIITTNNYYTTNV